jgi:two-component system OmpR family response regulator
MGSVIVIEDEADLLDSMCLFLATSGLDVRGGSNGVALDRLWAEQPVDILVLDLSLPGEDGMMIAKRMRQHSALGIIMMTARTYPEDRAMGLEIGADNYLSKPVVLRELVAAVRSLLRRLGQSGEARPHAWGFDRLNWTIEGPNGRSAQLTSAEFCLLSRLAASAGETIPAEDIVMAMGRAQGAVGRRGLETILSRLRRKVDEQIGMDLPVRSVRSVGYVLATSMKRT